MNTLLCTFIAAAALAPLAGAAPQKKAAPFTDILRDAVKEYQAGDLDKAAAVLDNAAAILDMNLARDVDRNALKRMK